jgi:hypothetical protein
MKKLKFIFKMLLFAALVAPWASCSKSDDNAPDDGKDKDPNMIVCEHVCDVANQVDVYFNQSQSIEELSQHLDDIKKIPYVEDAYTTSTTLFVKIKDYGEIFFSFFNKPEAAFIDEDLYAMTRSNLLREHPQLEGKRICIANAQNVEYLVAGEKGDRKSIAEETRKIFEDMGYEAHLFTALNLHFFKETMYDYDIVFLITHGTYNDEQNLHWIMGNEVGSLTEKEMYKIIYQDNNYTSDQVTFGKYKYTFTGEKWYEFDYTTNVSWKLWISEKFICNATEKTVSEERQGKAVFFNVACKSLMGQNGSENYNFADALLDRGFGAYYGYTESNYHGQATYFRMLNNLLSCMSLENSYNELPDELRDESKDEELVESEKKKGMIPKAKLCYKYKDHNTSIGRFRIIKPFAYTPENVSTDKIQIRFFGQAPSWRRYYLGTFFYEDEPDVLYYVFDDRDPLSCGFYISETPDYKDAYQVCLLSSSDKDNYEYSNHVVSFHYDLTYEPLSLQNLIVPGKDYYVWSYVYDGRDFYLSDPETFTTRVSVGGSVTPDIPGTDF